MKRTYISSQGVTFVEKPVAGMKIDSNTKKFTIHHWCIVGEPKLEGGVHSSFGGIETRTYHKLFTRSWFRFTLIPYLKFKIVRWLYKDLFDIQLKQKVKRYGLKIIRR